MTISASENFYHTYGCSVDECLRRYCSDHRLLWRDCETAKATLEGDREVGTHIIYEMGECPHCEHDYQRRKIQQLKGAA